MVNHKRHVDRLFESENGSYGPGISRRSRLQSNEWCREYWRQEWSSNRKSFQVANFALINETNQKSLVF